MTVRKYLDLSTAHIRQETADMLQIMWGDHMFEEPELGWRLIIEPHREYGWWIHVDHDNPVPDGVPDDLRRILEMAKANDCAWVLLDRDAAPIDSLPSYEW